MSDVPGLLGYTEKWGGFSWLEGFFGFSWSGGRQAINPGWDDYGVPHPEHSGFETILPQVTCPTFDPSCSPNGSQSAHYLTTVPDSPPFGPYFSGIQDPDMVRIQYSLGPIAAGPGAVSPDSPCASFPSCRGCLAGSGGGGIDFRAGNTGSPLFLSADPSITVSGGQVIRSSPLEWDGQDPSFPGNALLHRVGPRPSNPQAPWPGAPLFRMSYPGACCTSLVHLIDWTVTFYWIEDGWTHVL